MLMVDPFFCESTWGSFPFSLVNPSNYIQKFIPDFHHCHIFRNARARKFSLRCAFAQLWHQRAVAGRPSARSVDLCMSERGLTRLRISYGRWWTGYEELLWPLWGCWKRCVTLPGERKRNCWPEMFEWGVAAWHGNQCCISPSGGVGE